MPDNRPNIILINCDDLGYGDIGSYGSTVNRTPHLDRLAAEGLRCTDFCVASSLCSPSRAALFTGCYPQRVGLGGGEDHIVLMPGDRIGLGPDEISLATHLRRQGYATQAIGKWHLGDQAPFLPTAHGFDSYFGLPFSNDMGLGSPQGRRLRSDGFPVGPLPLLRDATVAEEEPDQAALTDRYHDEALRFVRANRERPFFLYLAHMYVHVPYSAPQRFLDQSRNGVYGAMVEHIDAGVGLLLAELHSLGLDQRTLIIFTSDNGGLPDPPASNAPLRGAKATLWEGGFRVPFLARWPGRIPAGAVCGELITAMDLLPSLGLLAGAPPPDDRVIDGRDIRPLLFAEPDARTPHEAFFYYLWNVLGAVRSGRWKLHLDERGNAGALYDLIDDVGETRDVSSGNPSVVARLLTLAERSREDIGDTGNVFQRRRRRGRGCRPVGRVAQSVPLTSLASDHPLLIAAYD